jgi:hypothetical protein
LLALRPSICISNSVFIRLQGVSGGRAGREARRRTSRLRAQSPPRPLWRRGWSPSRRGRWSMARDSEPAEGRRKVRGRREGGREAGDLEETPHELLGVPPPLAHEGGGGDVEEGRPTLCRHSFGEHCLSGAWGPVEEDPTPRPDHSRVEEGPRETRRAHRSRPWKMDGNFKGSCTASERSLFASSRPTMSSNLTLGLSW